MQVCFVKPGRTGYQYAHTERDVKWMESQGWQRYEVPQESIPEPKRKPGRPKKALDEHRNI
jgi:hypothetical protein